MNRLDDASHRREHATPRLQRIVVMQRGKIVQQGTHDEMKDVDGPYRDLIAHG